MSHIVREHLRSSRVFPIAQTAYFAVFNRPYYEAQRKIKNFYSAYFKCGDLVFDIGGNYGANAEVMLSLGARVVSVEPHPECAKVLRQIAQRSNLSVEEVAVGDKTGTATLHIGRESATSTLSDEWIAKAQGLCEYAWTGEITVPLTTLDALAAKYGVPNFVKIDVEGFEDKVLARMSFTPQAMTFEFHVDYLEALARCFEKIVLRGYSFNFMVKEEYACRLEQWQSEPAVIVNAIQTLGQAAHYGDIICRRN